MVWKFIKEVLSCFYPPKYKSLKMKTFWQSYGFVLKVLLVAFVISSIIMIPDMLKLKNEITGEVGKLQAVNITGKIVTTSPVNIPTKDPLVAIDTQTDRQLKNEFLVITDDFVKFRFLGKQQIEIDKFKQPSKNKAEIGPFIAKLVLLLAPGFILMIYLKIAIKYFILTWIFGILIFFLMDLTTLKLKFKKVLTITAYASAPIILIETISSTINPVWMMPFMRFLGINVYAISLLAWFLLAIICMIFSNISNHK